MKTFFFTCVLLATLPFAALANGGDQRVADGYLVNLSRSPFTPIAGVKIAMTVSFVDLSTMKLIKEDAVVYLARLGGPSRARTFHGQALNGRMIIFQHEPSTRLER